MCPTAERRPARDGWSLAVVRSYLSRLSVFASARQIYLTPVAHRGRWDGVVPRRRGYNWEGEWDAHESIMNAEGGKQTTPPLKPRQPGTPNHEKEKDERREKRGAGELPMLEGLRTTMPLFATGRYCSFPSTKNLTLNVGKGSVTSRPKKQLCGFDTGGHIFHV